MYELYIKEYQHLKEGWITGEVGNLTVWPKMWSTDFFFIIHILHANEVYVCIYMCFYLFQ